MCQGAVQEGEGVRVVASATRAIARRLLRMKGKLLHTCTLAFAAHAAQAQIVTNGSFSDGLGNFSFADWYTFCDATNASFACGGNAIAIAPNVMQSPCPFASTPAGIHTKLIGLQVGWPYQLTFCAEVDLNDGGNVGIFANTAGQMPSTYYGDGGIVDVWPAFGPGPMYYTIDFTIPTSYYGQDFWLFAEYSYAPDNSPAMKLYTGFDVVLNTGTPVPEANPGHTPQLIAAYGWLRPQAQTNVDVLEVYSATGALQLHADNWSGTSTAAWPAGVYVARLQLHDGTAVRQRFVVP